MARLETPDVKISFVDVQNFYESTVLKRNTYLFADPVWKMVNVEFSGPKQYLTVLSFELPRMGRRWYNSTQLRNRHATTTSISSQFWLTYAIRKKWGLASSQKRSSQQQQQEVPALKQSNVEQQPESHYLWINRCHWQTPDWETVGATSGMGNNSGFSQHHLFQVFTSSQCYTCPGRRWRQRYNAILV